MERVLLLVEDNKDDEALILRALRRSQLSPRVVVARDGVEALEYLHGKAGEHARAPAPDLVFLDVNLPKLSGLEVLRRIRADARTRGLPVVILTSSKEERDIVTSYELGASSYVRKPVASEQFVDAIGRLGSYWLELAEVLPAGLKAGGKPAPGPDGGSAGRS
jgi:two-component system, response regulator